MLVTNNLYQANSQPVDTMAPLSWFDKTGYYVVKDKIFRHKIYAMQEATRLKLGAEGIKWIFNDNVYDAQNWKNTPNISLLELYRLRAQQLRDKYSYLILSFSGGGDSTNILDSFVLNSIHLDEVIVGWPRSQTAGKYTPTLSTDAKNFLSEWDYLIEPKLKWLRSMSPRTKITIVDPYDNMRSSEPTEDLVSVTARHNYIGYLRYKAIDKELLDRQKKYKNCAMITGINPPMIARINRHLMSYFYDPITSMYASDYTENELYRNIEFFYWTPDMPEIPIIQSHALLDDLNSNPGLVNLVPVWELKTAKGRPGWVKHSNEDTRRWMKRVLYPTYNSLSLQVDKNTSPILKPEWFSWFYDNPHSTEIAQPHYSAIKSVQNLIDPCFLHSNNNEMHDYLPYRSKFYYVGDLKNF
jgi:hypothetical protein